MKPTVYLDTTIPSYLTAWPSSSLVRAAEQLLTKQFWERRDEFDLRISRFVIDECCGGDRSAADERLAAIQSLTILQDDEAMRSFAALLVEQIPLPQSAATDALHIAIAASHECEYLLTWNYRHLANPVNWKKLERLCDDAGLSVPTICTPELLLKGIDHGTR